MLNHVCDFAHAAAHNIHESVSGYVCGSDLLMCRETSTVMNHDMFIFKVLNLNTIVSEFLMYKYHFMILILS